MWSLGIVFIMLLTKKPLFDAATVDDKGFQLYNRVGLRSYLKTMCLEQSALCKVSDAMLDLAEGLLATDPAARITVKGALQSTWLNSEGHASRRHSSDFALPSKQFEHATASLIDE